MKLQEGIRNKAEKKVQKHRKYYAGWPTMVRNLHNFLLLKFVNLYIYKFVTFYILKGKMYTIKTLFL